MRNTKKYGYLFGFIASTIFFSACHKNNTTVNSPTEGSFIPTAAIAATTSSISIAIAVPACVSGHTISCKTFIYGTGTGVIPVLGSGSSTATCVNSAIGSMTTTATGTFSAGCNGAASLCTDVTTGSALNSVRGCAGLSPVYVYQTGSTCTNTILPLDC